MHGFILTLLTLDSLFLVLVVLLQSGKGTGLAAEFGGTSSSADTLMGGRQAATLLTKASWVTGAAFMGLALSLAILSARARAPASVLEGQLAPPTQEAPTPLLQREQEGALEGLIQQPTKSGEEGSEEKKNPPQGGN